MIKSFLFSLLLSLSFISQAQSTNALAALQQGSQFLPVEQAFVMDFRQQDDSTGQAKLQVSFTIADGYYLYKDKFKFVGIDAAFSHPQYPKGVMIHDEYFGESEVYFHQVVLDIPLSQLGSEAMLKVRFQGCAEAGLCYPVQTLDIPLIAPVADKTATDSASTAETAAELGMTEDSAAIASPGSAPVSEQLQLLDSLKTDSTAKALFLFFASVEGPDSLVISLKPATYLALSPTFLEMSNPKPKPISLLSIEDSGPGRSTNSPSTIKNSLSNEA